MTAAATTGPASGPRPASSQPATGHTPRLSAVRSRRNVGREHLFVERQARRLCVRIAAATFDHGAAAFATGATDKLGSDYRVDSIIPRRIMRCRTADRTTTGNLDGGLVAYTSGMRRDTNKSAARRRPRRPEMLGRGLRRSSY